MLDQTADPVARVSMRYARAAGALYLPLFLLGPFALLYARATVIVPGDAAATAGRIAAHDGLFRAAAVAELIIPLLDIALALAFYVLLKPVNQPISLLAAFFRLASAVMGLVSALTNFAVLLLLSDAGPSTAGQADELHVLALYLLNLHDYVLAIGLVAFAFHILIQGYLIQTSNLLPRVIGILLIVASAGYLVNSLRTLLALDWASEVQTFLLLPAFVAEVSLGLWLVVKGVRPVPATHVRQS